VKIPAGRGAKDIGFLVAFLIVKNTTFF